MRASELLLIAVALLCPLVVGGAPNEDRAALRAAVLMADSMVAKAEAYKKLFQKVGRAGLAELRKDEDTGVALQAAWELSKKPAKRAKKHPLLVDDIYQSDELAKFVTFLKERTKAPVPDWWANDITFADAFPGKQHSFPEVGYGQKSPPKLREAKASKPGNIYEVSVGAELEFKGDSMVYSAGKRAVEFPKEVFANADNSFTALMGAEHSIIACYPSNGGFSFRVAGFKDNGGKPVWKSVVWGAGRTILAGSAPHWVELTATKDAVFVFGGECAGMFVEAFDATTGKCLFRFCTGFWFNPAEAWGLK